MPDLRPVVAHSRVLALLNEHFPAGVTDLVTLEGGSVARTLAFRAGERDYVIRFNLDRMLNSNFPKEAYLWQRLASTPIPMPPVVQVGRLEDLHYAISLRMPGINLSNFRPHELEQLFPQIIETIYAVHQIDVGDSQGYGVFDDHGRGMSSSWHGFLKQIVEEELEEDYFGKWHSLFDETFLERAAFEEVYQQMVRLLDFCPEDRFLVHGSLSLANMLALPDKLTAVLDWLDARYGDFVYDIANLDYWTPVLRVRERFQQFYQQREILVPAYDERILCYQCYLTLAAMRFYAKSGQQQSYEYVRGRMLAKLRQSV
jgi:hygromycin-B 4-O-kinase